MFYNSHIITKTKVNPLTDQQFCYIQLNPNKLLAQSAFIDGRKNTHRFEIGNEKPLVNPKQKPPNDQIHFRICHQKPWTCFLWNKPSGKIYYV